MDSPDDACAVAAGIVALTERAVPSLDGLAQVMHSHGTPRERVGAVVHALEGYAELIDPNAPKRVHSAASGASTARSSWWKRLFG